MPILAVNYMTRHDVPYEYLLRMVQVCVSSVLMSYVCVAVVEMSLSLDSVDILVTVLQQCCHVCVSSVLVSLCKPFSFRNRHAVA